MNNRSSVRDDPAHAGVVEAFALGRSEILATHADVIVETLAVARRRYGPVVAADLIDREIPALEVAPVDADLHETAIAAFRDTVESSVSLVDRTSFAFMRREESSGRSLSMPTSGRPASRHSRSPEGLEDLADGGSQRRVSASVEPAAELGELMVGAHPWRTSPSARFA